MAEKKSHHLIAPLSTRRLEAFSDGVFAIAITLLILEIKVPHIDAAAGESLLSALAAQRVSYGAYFDSFLMIGIYWINHHYIFRFYTGTNHVFNLLNLIFLMSIAFLPYPTAVFSEYIEIPGQERAAVMFYAFGRLLPALSFCLMWLYASRNYRLIDRRLDETFVRHLRRQYSASVVIYIFTILVAWWNWQIGLAMCLGLSLLYLLRSKEPVLQEEK